MRNVWLTHSSAEPHSLQLQKTTSVLQDREHMLLYSNRLKKMFDSLDADHISGLVRLIRQINGRGQRKFRNVLEQA